MSSATGTPKIRADPTTSVIQGDLPCAWRIGPLEALSVVSQKWIPFPAALPKMVSLFPFQRHSARYSVWDSPSGIQADLSQPASGEDVGKAVKEESQAASQVVLCQSRAVLYNQTASCLEQRKTSGPCSLPTHTQRFSAKISASLTFMNAKRKAESI